MSKIYLINVGANAAHGSIARSPIFSDETFCFVPFPHPGTRGVRSYSKECVPFVRRIDVRDNHDDPDWRSLTYGDDCGNPRAASLKQVKVDDILLFWGMLWQNEGMGWEDFSGARNWYLIGALRVGEILEAGQTPQEASSKNISRASQNVHFNDGKLRQNNRVFVGNQKYSQRFNKAVDLQVNKSSGLVYQTIRSAKGLPLKLNEKPSWKSSLRSCREIFDLNNDNESKTVRLLRDIIKSKTNYDLLEDISPLAS